MIIRRSASCLVVLAVVVLGLFTAAANAADQSYLGKAKDAYRVLVIGDTLGPGLMFGLQRQAAGDLRLSIDGRFKEDSGLTRPEFQDWAEALPRILDANDIDIVVVFLGSNDGQPIRVGASAFAFNSPQWQAAYAARVDRLIAVIKTRGVPGYWIGLPPMADASFDANVQAIAAVQKARVTAAGVRYVDLRPAFADASGAFANQGPDDTGAVRRLRDSDGLHFTKAGNSRAGQLLLAALQADIAAADGTAAAAASPAAAAPAAAAAGQPETPVFGQAQLVPDGDDATTVRPEFMPPSAPAAVAMASDAAAQAQSPVRQVITESELSGRALMDELARGAAQGSSAAVLFTTGQPPAPKTRRLDDFSAATPQP